MTTTQEDEVPVVELLAISGMHCLDRAVQRSEGSNREGVDPPGLVLSFQYTTAVRRPPALQKRARQASN
ncbi:hypothetical protein [Streptomyces sp. NPDC001933]|uniref:hypothetical protein n=1 Tax=Streptomyces sp. NPDC001933 TaxID=3364626 RepID=UPI0036BA5C8A